MASCILHNICILEKDDINYFMARTRNVSYQKFKRKYQTFYEY